ncbi:hypothetical protein VCSRO12_3639 [Vibrio cholerae]|nr:hypothetical protein VCSRO12_3639 [Vibrio cholerae]
MTASTEGKTKTKSRVEKTSIAFVAKSEISTGTAQGFASQLGNTNEYWSSLLEITTSPYLLLKTTFSSWYLERIAAPAPKLP